MLVVRLKLILFTSKCTQTLNELSIKPLKSSFHQDYFLKNYMLCGFKCAPKVPVRCARSLSFFFIYSLVDRSELAWNLILSAPLEVPNFLLLPFYLLLLVLYVYQV